MAFQSGNDPPSGASRSSGVDQGPRIVAKDSSNERYIAFEAPPEHTAQKASLLLPFRGLQKISHGREIVDNPKGSSTRILEGLAAEIF